MAKPEVHGPPHARPPQILITVEVRYHENYDRWCAYALAEETDLFGRPAARMSVHQFGETAEVSIALALEALLLDRQYELLF